MAEHKQIHNEDREFPERLAIANLVNHTCIPLMSDKRLVGLLDLRWTVGQSQSFSIDYHHDEQNLCILGEVIGSAYMRQRLTEERTCAAQAARQSEIAIEAMGAMVFQSAHRLKNLLLTLDRLAEQIEDSANETEGKAVLTKMKQRMEEGYLMITRPLETAERVHQLRPERCSLNELIKQVLGEAEKDVDKDKVKIYFPALIDLEIRVDEEHTREAFVNLVNNAINTVMQKGGGGVIIASSVAEDRRNAQVIFEDTGEGMSEQEIDDALRGFVATQSRKGVGVMLSRVLIEAQGGVLFYESVKGVGTRAIVRLPLA